MSRIVDTSSRSKQEELMDDFSIEGPVLYDTLDKLALLNKWLGGTNVTIRELKKLLKDHPVNQELILIDLGCGGGELLREIAEYANKKGYQFRLIGIDANEHTLKYANDLSTHYPNIEFIHCDVFSEEFKTMQYDIVLSTLFLHHFSDEKLVDLLQLLICQASMGIIINDLHRHWLAYYLFKLVSLFIPNRMVKEDGLTSVLRGFKRSELEVLSARINRNTTISWKWAFRYLWIITIKK